MIAESKRKQKRPARGRFYRYELCKVLTEIIAIPAVQFLQDLGLRESNETGELTGHYVMTAQLGDYSKCLSQNSPVSIACTTTIFFWIRSTRENT
jgi:hypothetical protein